MKAATFFLIIVALSKDAFCAELPADVKKCRFGNATCIAETINSLIQRYPKGIPEIGLPPLDEAELKQELSILSSTRSGPVWFDFKLINNINKGFNNATITHVEGFDRDPTKNKLEIRARIPRVVHQAIYEFLGRILVFQVNTTGKLESDFQNVRFVLNFKVFVEYRNNKRYLKIYELVPLLELDRWIIWMDDLYKENVDLTIAMNRLFNEHWVEFWNELEPGLLNAFKIIFTDLLTKVFETISYDNMFLQD